MFLNDGYTEILYWQLGLASTCVCDRDRETEFKREHLDFWTMLAKDSYPLVIFKRRKRAFILILLWVWHSVLQI